MTTKTLSPRIVRKIVPNPECLVFEVNRAISDDYMETFHLPLSSRSNEYLDKVGPVGTALVQQLARILGCTQICIQRYSVTVTIGGAFRPEEDGIIGSIIDALKECFGENKDAVQVSTVDDCSRYRSELNEGDDSLGAGW